MYPKSFFPRRNSKLISHEPLQPLGKGPPPHRFLTFILPRSLEIPNTTNQFTNLNAHPKNHHLHPQHIGNVGHLERGKNWKHITLTHNTTSQDGRHSFPTFPLELMDFYLYWLNRFGRSQACWSTVMLFFLFFFFHGRYRTTGNVCG